MKASVFLQTLGCPKNTEDSERMQAILIDKGFDLCSSAEDADVLILNTCGFIDAAKRESIGAVLELAQIKNINRKPQTLVVTGCLSQRYKDELFCELDEVDIMLGVNDYENIGEIIDDYLRDKSRKLIISENSDILTTSRSKLVHKHYAYLKVAEGCDNSCTYCTIPSIRGPLRSMPMENLIKEAGELAVAGAKEVILIAQDVSAYGLDLYGSYRLADLLRELNSIDKIKWIRLMYCYEDRITDDLIETMASLDKVIPYIDLPIQHISETILKLMNRNSTPTSIRQTLKRLRSKLPNITIRTTLITGFPGESEDDFDELYDFISEICFDRLGVFAYSKEDGTLAAHMPNQVEPEIAEARRESLMLRQLDISKHKNESLCDKIFDVIIDEIEDENGSLAYVGRTVMDAPEIDNSVIFTSHKLLYIGDMVQVRITSALDYDLIGEEIESEEVDEFTK